jgi:hypothetical protein
MTLSDLIKVFRSDADDVALPNQFADEEVIEYAVDAQMEAARRARLLTDSTTAEICRAAITADDPWVQLDPRVIFVRRAIVDGRTIPLCKAQQREMDASVPGWESSVSSSVTHYIADAQSGSLRLWPPPSVSGTLRLTVVREPLVAMEDMADEPEIPTRYHRSLVYWMLYRGFSRPDSDTYDKERAALNLALFEQEFGKRSSAQEEEWSRKHYGMDEFEGQY